MQISEYPSIPQAPADDDVLAIEANGITYKVRKSDLVPIGALSAISTSYVAVPSELSTSVDSILVKKNAFCCSVRIVMKANITAGTTVIGTISGLSSVGALPQMYISGSIYNMAYADNGLYRARLEGDGRFTYSSNVNNTNQVVVVFAFPI